MTTVCRLRPAAAAFRVCSQAVVRFMRLRVHKQSWGPLENTPVLADFHSVVVKLKCSLVLVQLYQLAFATHLVKC